MEKSWSNLADNFDEIGKYVTGIEIDKKIKDELHKLNNLGDLLEVACGTGNYTRHLAKASNNILASDISEDMLRFAKKNLKNIDNIIFDKLDCYKTGLSDSAFDSVFMGNIIHVVENPKLALSEAWRTLKPDGKLIIVSYTTDGMPLINIIGLSFRYIKSMGTPPKGGTKFKLKSLNNFISANGFKVEQSKLITSKKANAIFLVAKKI